MEIDSGTVVVIVGASSGIGAALAELLGTYGTRLCLGARRLAELKDVAGRVEAAGGEALARKTDVTVREEVDALVDEALSAFGHIDVHVNNAGQANVHSVEDTSREEMQAIFDVNLLGTLYGMQAVLPHFRSRRRGHLINIASLGGKLPLPLNGAYMAAKHAVVALSHTLRLELQGSGIDVSIVYPGRVRSEGRKMRGIENADAFYGEVMRRAQRIALERGNGPFSMAVAEPMDIARSIVGCIRTPVPEVFPNAADKNLVAAFAQNPQILEQVLLPFFQAAVETYRDTPKP